MDWKYWFKINLALCFFLCLIIVGTNISAKQLGIITNQNIAAPFLLTYVARDAINLDLLGESYQLSTIPAQESYSFLKSSIQKTWVGVKSNIAPRAAYLRYQWGTGVKQLREDLTRIAPDF